MKIETDCNIVSSVFLFFSFFFSFVSLTNFPTPFLLFITFDITLGRHICLT